MGDDLNGMEYNLESITGMNVYALVGSADTRCLGTKNLPFFERIADAKLA